MNIAVIGATGNAGSRILAEALGRGHSVTAIVRDPSKIKSQPRLSVKAGDLSTPQTLSTLLSGHDVVVSAFNPPRGSANYAQAALSGNQNILHAAIQAKVPRYVVVGGAGTLLVADGVQLIDTPHFPAEYKVEAGTMRDFFNILQKETKIDWVFVAPPALFMPGTKTGRYRVGHNYLMADANGKSTISMEDFAIAVLSEIELPAHHRERFTVAY